MGAVSRIETSGAGDDWENDRVRISYEEARTVIDHQLGTIADIDDKAMYTVRVIVIFVGIVVAAARIGGSDLFQTELFGFGLLALIISLGAGILTYSSSNLFVGPNRAYLEDLVEGDVDADRWDDDLVNRLGDWIASNGADRDVYALLLSISQLFPFLGVVLLALSVVL